MRVKWNRNLDGVRPLITVPETDVISDAKYEVQNNDNNTSFPDLNYNTTNTNDSHVIKVRTCESPSPSSASVTSKRSDKSKTRISSLFGLFKLKERVIDNNNEDCVSNYSELSNSVINPTMPSMTIRRKSYESGDSMISGLEKIGFEADTRRRRRANTLLLKSSMRRSWQQLNGHSKLSVPAGYLVCREPRILYSNYTHSPLQSLRRKISEPDLLISSRSSLNRAITNVLPQVGNELNSDNLNAETNKTCLNINSDRETVKTNTKTNINIDELHRNDIIDKTDEQIKCMTSANLNENNSLNGCGCDDEVDKVQNVTKIVNSLDSQQNSINNSKTITDPKNNSKNNKTEHKNINIVNNTISKVRLQSDICVTNTNDMLDLDSDKTDSIDINIVEKTTLSNDQINDHFLSIKHNLSEENNNINNNNNIDKQSEQSIIRVEEVESIELTTNTSETSISTDIVKVKVKKNQLPEFEVVSFTSNRTPSPSPSTVSPINYSNDEAVVVTFIDDEPMTKTTKSDVLIKSTPIQGILRLRSHKDSNSEDNSSDSLTKTMGPKISQKKVHFADNCLHNRHTNRVRSRPLKSRHYGSYGTNRTIRTIRTNL
jgi:hypothetical protein